MNHRNNEEILMKPTALLFIFALLLSFSCSKSSKERDEAELAENAADLAEDTDFIVDSEDEDLTLDGDETEVASSEEGLESEGDSLDDSESSSEPEIAENTGPVEMGEEESTYTVKSGETLMLIAFNLYGDYRKWKDIQSLNGLSGTSISEGMTLKYKKPETEFSWDPQGLPYLIKRGDTLGKISNEKYGTPKKWNLIYDNNKPLIKDPNLIFAGFTLYYISERDLASE